MAHKTGVVPLVLKQPSTAFQLLIFGWKHASRFTNHSASGKLDSNWILTLFQRIQINATYRLTTKVNRRFCLQTRRGTFSPNIWQESTGKDALDSGCNSGTFVPLCSAG
ncbi:hypothetical protein WG66_017117 [Moniliophthora roreri]|nr:hypothetical protein WG66_017117 [Moniliophthora roreri]